MAQPTKAKIPRSFKLLDEHDAAIGKMGKSYICQKHAGYIQYGINEDLINEAKDPLSHWRGMIIGIQGKQTGQLMYSFLIDVPPDYPEMPPKMKFVEPKMAMACVGKDGTVDFSKIKPAFKWNKDLEIAHLLMALRDNMEDSTVCQQSEHLGGTRY